jgi:hypothetical protein
MALSDKIDALLKARQVIKQKLKQNKMQEEATQEQFSRLTTPLVEQINEPIIQKLGEITKIPSLPALTDAPPSPPSSRRTVLATKKRKGISLDVDKNIDEDIIRQYKLLRPSEYLSKYKEPERSVQISAVVVKLNSYLQSLGGQKKRPEVAKTIEDLINKLRHYKISLLNIQKIPHFEVAAAPRFSFQQEGTPTKSLFQIGSTPERSQTGKGGLCRDDPCQRLELLIGSREAGNDSPDVLKEAKTILETLFKEGKISRNDRDMIELHFL